MSDNKNTDDFGSDGSFVDLDNSDSEEDKFPKKHNNLSQSMVRARNAFASSARKQVISQVEKSEKPKGDTQADVNDYYSDGSEDDQGVPDEPRKPQSTEYEKVENDQEKPKVENFFVRPYR